MVFRVSRDIDGPNRFPACKGLAFMLASLGKHSAFCAVIFLGLGFWRKDLARGPNDEEIRILWFTAVLSSYSD